MYKHVGFYDTQQVGMEMIKTQLQLQPKIGRTLFLVYN